MKKKISEMTAEEKKQSIFDAERDYTCHDFGRGAAALLEEYMEMNDLQDDSKISTAIKKLHSLEHEIVVLYNQYKINMTNEYVPLIKGHEQQIAKMNQRHIEERSRVSNSVISFGVTKLTKAQEKERADLLAAQTTEKEKVRKKLTKDMDECKKELSNVFNNAIRYMYR